MTELNSWWAESLHLVRTSSSLVLAGRVRSCLHSAPGAGWKGDLKRLPPILTTSSWGKGCESCICRESLWYIGPKSSLWFLCFSVKASRILRNGNGPHKHHVVSSLTLSFSILQTTSQSESSSLPGHQLTCTTYSGLVHISVYVERQACSCSAEMKLRTQVSEPTFTFKIVSKNPMYINIYKQQQYAENTFQPQSYVQTSS